MKGLGSSSAGPQRVCCPKEIQLKIQFDCRAEEE